MNKQEIRKFLCVLVLGVVLLGIGLGMYFGSDYDNPDRIESTGTIIEIVEIKNEKEEIQEQYAIVEYIVDGNTYSGKLNYYINTMKKGNTVNIFYSKSNPGEFAFRSITNWLPILIMAFGAFFIAFAFPSCKLSSWIYKLRMRKFDKYRKYGYIPKEEEEEQ